MVSGFPKQLSWSESLQLGLSESDSQQSSLCTLRDRVRRQGASESGQLQELSETFELFTCCLNELPCRMECFSLGGNCYTSVTQK